MLRWKSATAAWSNPDSDSRSMPLCRRTEATQLLSLTPGATNQSGNDEPTGGLDSVIYSVNGGRTEYNNWEIDGGNNMDDGSNTTLLTFPSVDAIAEVVGAH